MKGWGSKDDSHSSRDIDDLVDCQALTINASTITTKSLNRHTSYFSRRGSWFWECLYYLEWRELRLPLWKAVEYVWNRVILHSLPSGKKSLKLFAVFRNFVAKLHTLHLTTRRRLIVFKYCGPNFRCRFWVPFRRHQRARYKVCGPCSPSAAWITYWLTVAKCMKCLYIALDGATWWVVGLLQMSWINPLEIPKFPTCRLLSVVPKTAKLLAERLVTFQNGYHLV